MKLLLLFISLIIVIPAYAQELAGVFPFNSDIGNPKMKGSTQYDSVNQVYTLKGGGEDIWNNHDQFHYLWKKLRGDFILTANFKLIGGSDDPQRKTGWMIRRSDDPNSAFIGTALHGNGLTVMQWRTWAGAFMKIPDNERFYSKRNAEIMQLERKGNLFIMRAGRFGEPLQTVGLHVMKNMTGEVMAGLFVCSHDTNAIEQVKVWNVRIDQLVPTDHRTWQIGSRLEILNIFNGNRKLVYQTKGRIESPNWMRNDKKILFDSEGLLYTIPLKGGLTEEFKTNFGSHLGGNHCISIDGKMLGISYRDAGGPKISVFPIKGGTPKTITHEIPFYLHGISPDNEDVVYVQRNIHISTPVYDIYKQPLEGGDAIRLTRSKAYEYADGCEYSPDGRYIYYNASQNGGTMQIWRMKPDGSDKEQLTFGPYNNWFPHISPNGKWLAFISYPSGIKLNTHPYFSNVMIRLMPTAGGAPMVIARLYGGQGSLDVNSWSPDSKHIAFVSYTTH